MPHDSLKIIGKRFFFMKVLSYSTTIDLTRKVMVIKIRLWNKNLLSLFEITQLPNSVCTHPDSSREAGNSAQ